MYALGARVGALRRSVVVVLGWVGLVRLRVRVRVRVRVRFVVVLGWVGLAVVG